MQLNIRVEGLDEIIRGMNDPQSIAGPVNGAMQKSAFWIRQAMVERAPVGVSGGSGAGLQGSISVAFAPPSPLIEWATIGPRVFYGVFFALGTRPHWPPWGEGSPLR